MKLWNLDTTITEDYPHKVLKPYALTLEEQTEGVIKPKIENKISLNGFRTIFNVNVGDVYFPLFEVRSDNKLSVYPVKIVVEPRRTGSSYHDSLMADYIKEATDAKSLEEELDKLIETDMMASKIGYLLQLNKLENQKHDS
jgi:hypothetical protein